jgi:microcin C transport system substrate-binding protein
LNARFFQRACGAALLIAIPMMTAAKASASEREWRHGLSLFGDLKYKPDFKHFDYVNPDAPKGGSVRQLAIGTFDNFNLVVAGVKGAMAVGVDLVFDTLTAPALDEVSAAYGLLAESVSYPEDFSSVTYRLRPQAKFHDGTPVTPEDVIFSFNAFKQNSPQLSAYYQHVTKAEKTGEREITFTSGTRAPTNPARSATFRPPRWSLRSAMAPTG